MDQGNHEPASASDNHTDTPAISFEELAAITNSLPGGVAQFAFHSELTLLYASDGFYRITGYTRGELRGKTGVDFLKLMVPQEDVSRIYEHVREQRETGNKLKLEFRIKRKNAALIWVRMDASISRNSGNQNVIRCIFVDITSEKLLRQELEIEQKRYRIITEQLNDVFFEYNFENDSIYASSKWQEIFGYLPPQEHFISSVLNGEMVYEDDKVFLTQILERVRKGQPTSEVEIRVCKAGGGYMWASVSVTVLCDESGNLVKAIGKISDIDERRRERDKLISNAQHDPLTGLYNKIAVESFIRSYLRSSDGNIRHAMMIIDVDDFKGINDHLGHLFGDAVLSEISEKLQTVFRSTDLIGRFGGDEFLVFLKNVGDWEQVAQKARAVCDIFRQTYTGENRDYKISGSVGISIFPEHGKNFYELFQAADTALYAAKNKGKDGFVIYGESGRRDSGCGQSSEQDRGEKEHRKLRQTVKSTLVMDVYEMLRETNDGRGAVQFILRMVGREFNADRVYIYEGESDLFYLSTEWHAESVAPVEPAQCTGGAFGYALPDFEKYGAFYCADLGEFAPEILPYRASGSRRGSTVLQFPIYRNNVFAGMVGFDGTTRWLADEQKILLEICKIIGSFLNRLRQNKMVRQERDLLKSMTEGAGVLSYVVQPETYRLLYMNPMVEEMCPKAKLGEACYAALRSRGSLCENCPASRENRERAQNADVYDAVRQEWYNMAVSAIDWQGGRASLLCGTDVTRYLKKRKEEPDGSQ